MSYLTALGCVLAIIAIIIVGGVIIAFLGNIIINAFDVNRKDKKTIDEDDEIQNIRDNVYSNQNANTYTNTNQNINTNNSAVSKEESFSYKDEEDDYNYAKEVDSAVARKEKEALEREIKDSVDDDFFSSYKSELQSKPASEEDDDLDDLDLMGMIDEISQDVIDEKKTDIDYKAVEQEKKNSSLLNKYSVDSILNDDLDDEDDEEDEVVETVEPKKESANLRDEILAVLNEVQNNNNKSTLTDEEVEERIDEEVKKRVDARIEESLEFVNELKEALAKKEEEISEISASKVALENQYSEINKKMVEQFNHQNMESERKMQEAINAQISVLKAQLADVTKQLEEERSMNWKVTETAPAVSEKSVKVVDSNVVSQPVEEPIEVIQEIYQDDTIKELVNEEMEQRVEAQVSEASHILKEVAKKVEIITSDAVVGENVVTFQYSTEDQYLQRIEVLEERLKNAKKDLKINDKEFKPLEKVKRTLERDKTKLRRKEAIAAKKKVALYGVNNYVDIDKEKAEKLAHELELLDGLRLSVSHCEDVMNANVERYPILERTHKILTNNISDIETDLALLRVELKALRDKSDKDTNK